MIDVSMMPNSYLTEREALGFHLVNDRSQVEARLLSSIEELLGFHLSLSKELLGFHLIRDRSQAEARLLSLTKKLLGFHLVSDGAQAEARLLFL